MYEPNPMKDRPFDQGAAVFVLSIIDWADRVADEELVLPGSSVEDRLELIDITPRMIRPGQPQPEVAVAPPPKISACTALVPVPAPLQAHPLDRAMTAAEPLVRKPLEVLLATGQVFAEFASRGYGIGVLLALGLNFALMDVGSPTNVIGLARWMEAFGLALLSWLRVAWVFAGGDLWLPFNWPSHPV